MQSAGRLVFWCLLSLSQCLAGPSLTSFKKRVLSEDFFSEGACFADIDADGRQDVISGPYWYAGPDFQRRHAYTTIERFPIAVYSRHFFSFTCDFNQDGRPDILAIPMPGQPAHWFENPGSTGVLWRKHLAFEWVGNESPTLTDLTGDGKPELLFCYDKKLGYAEPDWRFPTRPWKFTAITGDRGFTRFTHGLGVGDVNGDGRLDVLETHGWWEQPPEKGALFTLHPFRFAESGGAQMFTDDVDGDGDQDVISVQNAHGYGLSWFEQIGAKPGASPQFQRHAILTEKPSDNPYGLSISQMHATALADIDGDGIKDIITGKRFWAHGGGDPGSQELPVLYWFRNVRRAHGVEFQPWLIDERSGVGTQLTVGDFTGDGLADIVVGNKLGTFAMIQERTEVDDDAHAAALPKPSGKTVHLAGTALFAEPVRTTGPRTPTAERAAFVLPEGFEIQLVAAEPDIAKPMNLAFDGRGRLWVSSSLEYPYAAPEDRAARDTIKILEDTTGDGHADKITTFAEGLNIPMGIYPYRDGVVCFSIPNIWFLRDTDGDGRADTRERLYGPFDCTRDTHGMCNSFTRGPDGWLYACHGFNNESTVRGRDGHAVTLRSGNTFRMRLDGSRIEQVGHGQVNPFGMTFDRNGDLFTADCHTKPINLILPGGYHDSFGRPHDGLGYVPNVMEHLHGSTGIAGIALGEATHFPIHYQNSTFGGNVVTSRINRNRLVRRGSSIVAEEQPDFLIAGDPWFRPVDLQVGPDGALYVADFYNAIIGHYEVPLTHPKRDRYRGRIWKIIHKSRASARGEDGKVSPSSGPLSRDLRKASLDSLLSSLEGCNPVQAGLILDELSLREPDRLATAVRSALPSASPQARIHLLWALSRRGMLRPEEIWEAGRDGQPAALRVAAYHLLGATAALPRQGDVFLRAGLQGSEPLVRRAAAMATAQHAAPTAIPALLEAHRSTDGADVHGRHAIKIALKQQLRDAGVFSAFEGKDPSEDDLPILADACVAVDHAAAAEFVLGQFDRLATLEPAKMIVYLRFLARSTGPDAVEKVVRLAREAVPNDPSLQLELLQAVRDGLEQQGVAITSGSPGTEALRAWAADLARDGLGSMEDAIKTLPWTPSKRGDEDPWGISTRRAASDGQSGMPLWSSFPRGERRTGRLRSAPFALGENLHFYLAGHDGFPSKPPQGRNAVRLRESGTDKILLETRPPRTDTAQPISWDTSAHAGRLAYVELVDGDDGVAYAWLAAGRFSVEGLNPSSRPAQQARAAALVEDFHLDAFRDLLAQLLKKQGAVSEATAPLARAYHATGGATDPHFGVLANALDLPLQDAALRERTVHALLEPDGAEAGPLALLQAWMQGLPREGQVRLAEHLAQSPPCASSLLSLVQSGHASARLLQTPTVAETLTRTLPPPEIEIWRSLTEGLPHEAEALEETITQRIREYEAKGGDADRGQTLFAQQCASCHQIGAAGTVLGPNLDGIGSRGLARLTEDILDPSRNVDVAFRLSTVTTRTGQVHVGLIRGTEGAQLRLADPTGKETTIPIESIQEKSSLTLSLMPATFADALAPEEFRHLQAYLLSLRN